MADTLKRLKIALCDDSPADRDYLLGLLTKYMDRHHHVAKIDLFTSGEELLATDISSYDLVVLDIFMDELNGVQVAEQLVAKNAGVQIIFCSTSNAYAAESYDVSALRYLIKPVPEEKMFRTLDRFFYAYTALRSLNFKLNRMDEHVYLSEVLWIEAGDHKSVIHTRNGSIQTPTEFKQLCQQVEDADFVKPIRYAMVSLKAITAIPTDVLTLCDGTQIPVSRGMRADMKKLFSDYKMKELLKRGGI